MDRCNEFIEVCHEATSANTCSHPVKGRICRADDDIMFLMIKDVVMAAGMLDLLLDLLLDLSA